jgi:hypothetical protein
VQAAQAPAEAFDLALAAQRALAMAGMVLDAERARLIVGRALAARGKPDQAAAELRRAQAVFERLGARPSPARPPPNDGASPHTPPARGPGPPAPGSAR